MLDPYATAIRIESTSLLLNCRGDAATDYQISWVTMLVAYGIMDVTGDATEGRNLKWRNLRPHWTAQPTAAQHTPKAANTESTVADELIRP